MPGVIGMCTTVSGVIMFGLVNVLFMGRVIHAGGPSSLHLRRMVHSVLTGMCFLMRFHIMVMMFRHLLLLLCLSLDYLNPDVNRRYAKWRLCRMKRAI
jgi:hypothetical protein